MRVVAAARGWRWTWLVIAAIAIAGLVASFTVANPTDSGDIGRAGIALLLLAIAVLLDRLIEVLKAPQQMREVDYQVAYRDGWRAGHREARPVIVPFPTRNDAASRS